MIDAWLNAIEAEALRISDFLDGIEPVTLYIGGGTPSLLGREGLGRIIGMAQRLGLPRGAEATFEANPDDLTSSGSLDPEKGAPEGITRVSLGVQTFDDGLLRYLGRRHDGDVAFKALEALFGWGVSISADLIFAIPGQKLTGFMADAERLISLGCGHISLYDLHLDEGVPLAKDPMANCEREALEEAGASMYSWIWRRLSTAGFNRYEVSNFSRPGLECRHNLAYWSDLPYVGLGPGAHSYAAGQRWFNEPDLHAYLASDAVRSVTVLSRRDHMSEFMIMGLRKASGVGAEQFMRTFGTNLSTEWGPVLERFFALGLVKYDFAGVRMTDRGFEMGNLVFSGFL